VIGNDHAGFGRAASEKDPQRHLADVVPQPSRRCWKRCSGRAARRGAPSDDRGHRRGADADHRHQAGVPGVGRVGGDGVPSPEVARAQNAQAAADTGQGDDSARALAGARRAALRAVRRRLPGGDLRDAAGRGHLPVLDANDVPGTTAATTAVSGSGVLSSPTRPTPGPSCSPHARTSCGPGT
jgi:hypothetical protein